MATESEYLCAEYWSNVMFYPLYALPLCRGLALLSLIPFIAVFVKAFYKKELQSETRFFYQSLIFFTMVCIWYLAATLLDPLACNESVPDQIAFAVLFTCYAAYGLQSALLTLNLFLRLLFVFKDSVFDVSTYTRFAFEVLFGICILLFVAGIILSLSAVDAGGICLGLAAAIYVGGVIWLNALFVYKLMKLHQMSRAGNIRQDQDHLGLVYVAIKTSLLCFVSTCSIVAFLTSFVLSRVGIVDSPHLKFMLIILGVCDLHTNFFSVLLTFTYFDAWYQKLCGRCCHQQCQKICIVRNPKKYVSVDMRMVSYNLEAESRIDAVEQVDVAS